MFMPPGGRAPRADGFNLDTGMPRGPTHVVRAAKDPVTVPGADPLIEDLLRRTLCRAQLGVNCYEVIGMNDRTMEIGYGASLDEWTRICGKLLAESLWKTP